jgi:hypothetical protein
MAGSSERNAIAASIGWWYLRRQIRKRGLAALTGFAVEEGLSLVRQPRKRHPVRWLLLLSLVAGAGAVLWRLQQAGRDEPVGVAPVNPEPAKPKPVVT